MKPLYGKILVSKNFDNKADAEEFAKEMRKEYREADISLKYDINRTETGQWKATVYAKL